MDMADIGGLLCPITCDIMRDPVILAGDGHTYERKAIEEWLRKGNLISPATGASLGGNCMLFANIALRKTIEEMASSGMLDPSDIYTDVGGVVRTPAAAPAYAPPVPSAPSAKAAAPPPVNAAAAAAAAADADGGGGGAAGASDAAQDGYLLDGHTATFTGHTATFHSRGTTLDAGSKKHSWRVPTQTQRVPTQSFTINRQPARAGPVLGVAQPEPEPAAARGGALPKDMVRTPRDGLVVLASGGDSASTLQTVDPTNKIVWPVSADAACRWLREC